MAPPGPLRVVSHGGRRFLCFCGDGGGSPRLQLTDACDFWSCSVPLEKLNGQEEPGSPADSLSRLREMLQGQTPMLTLQDGRATLQIQDGGQSMTFNLDKASVPEARRQLQDLTFGLVEQLQTLEKCMEDATSVALRSPEKISASQSLLGADFSPWKPRGGAGPSKRRLPGESLINPGFRRCGRLRRARTQMRGQDPSEIVGADSSDEEVPEDPVPSAHRAARRKEQLQQHGRLGSKAASKMTPTGVDFEDA